MLGKWTGSSAREEMITVGKPPAPSDYAILLCPLSRADGGGYLAVVPDLPGCLADGDTPEQAFTNAQDAHPDRCSGSSCLPSLLRSELIHHPSGGRMFPVFDHRIDGDDAS